MPNNTETGSHDGQSFVAPVSDESLAREHLATSQFETELTENHRGNERVIARAYTQRIARNQDWTDGFARLAGERADQECLRGIGDEYAIELDQEIYEPLKAAEWEVAVHGAGGLRIQRDICDAYNQGNDMASPESLKSLNIGPPFKDQAASLLQDIDRDQLNKLRVEYKHYMEAIPILRGMIGNLAALIPICDIVVKSLKPHDLSRNIALDEYNNHGQTSSINVDSASATLAIIDRDLSISDPETGQLVELVNAAEQLSIAGIALSESYGRILPIVLSAKLEATGDDRESLAAVAEMMGIERNDERYKKLSFALKIQEFSQTILEIQSRIQDRIRTLFERYMEADNKIKGIYSELSKALGLDGLEDKSLGEQWPYFNKPYQPVNPNKLEAYLQGGDERQTKYSLVQPLVS